MSEAESPGPSVESDDPQSRISARRRRIVARNAAKKRRQQSVADPSIVFDDEESASQKQVEESEKKTFYLQNDGTELVTNVQVAADAKESMRRTEGEEIRRLRVEELENEAKSSLEKFEEVSSRWATAKQQLMPKELLEALKSQQELCALLLKDKDKVIADLQQELKDQDDSYVKDLKIQADEVDLTIERMEEQAKNMMKTYRQELDQIENVYEEERQVLLTGNMKKWEQYLNKRRDKELENLNQRMKKVEEYETMLQHLRVEDSKEYSMIKDKLDTEVETLEQQLQQMKATTQLNQEKLDYNIRVLEKRSEENNHVKAQQRRKITRRQDLMNTLKEKFVKQEKQCQTARQHLSEELERSVQQCRHMQKMTRRFAAVNTKKFEEVWRMNKEEVMQLVERALDIDRLIHEQQLGLAWQRPSMDFMVRSGPTQNQEPAESPDSQRARSSPSTADASVGPGSESDTGAMVGAERDTSEMVSERSSCAEVKDPAGWREKVPATTVKKLLELLCDEAGFLIEGKLRRLLSPLEKDEQSLVKLEAIFPAMGIEREEEIYKLAEFFLDYRRQQREQAEGDDGSSSTTNMASDLLHPDDILAALKALTAEQRRIRELPTPPSSTNLYDVGGRCDNEDAAFWENMANVIPQTKLKTWNALEHALEKYHAILAERSQLITETQAVKQQNAELRMLLHQYLNSQVNAELEIPPIQMLRTAPLRQQQLE